MSATQIRRYVATIPGSGHTVEFSSPEPAGTVVEVRVDGRLVPFVLTDTAVHGGRYVAEPTRSSYL